jgi:predicted N-acyltransferase
MDLQTESRSDITYKVKIYNSITELRKEDWDLLTENNVYMCYEWLKTFEETTKFPVVPYYITVNIEENVIGAAVCYLEQRNESRIIDRVLLGRLYRYPLIKRLSFMPSLICNHQRGDGTHFVFSSELDATKASLLQTKILNVIEDVARQKGVSICFLNVAEEEAALKNLLKQNGYYETFDLPTNFIDVNWISFEDYKKRLSQKYPYMDKSIRHELNRNQKSGVVIEQLQDICACQERLIDLLKMNHFKYNSSFFPLRENYFQKLKENFGNNAVIYTAKKNRTIIGVSVVLRKGNEAFFSSVGVDHELSKKDFTFFNIGYYKPIEDAIGTNIKRIYFGRGLYETKIKRGCNIKGMQVFYQPRNVLTRPILKLWFPFHKRWMSNKLSHIKEI